MDKDTLSGIIDVIMLIYVALPLLLLLFIGIYYLVGKRLHATTVTTLIDIGKWYMVSVALVFVGKMVEGSFTERETGIKEMETYNRYADIAMSADVDKIVALSRYFAAVTPTPRLQRGWKAYYDLIEADYKKIQETRAAKLLILNDTNLTPAQRRDSINSKDSRIASLESGIVMNTSNLDIKNNSPKNTDATRPNTTAISGDTAKDEATLSMPFFWEQKGFQALLDKDVSAAIVAFNNAEQALHGFHMVYDIWFYLRRSKKEGKLLDKNNETEWKDCYRTVLSQYSWRMPKEMIAEFKARI